MSIDHSQPVPRQAPRRPELLAPAGDRTCAKAAVENGADAIYFGLDNGFNARARATNLHLDELPEFMAWLHERAVKGFVTLNTLVFSDELNAVEQVIEKLSEARVDAVLVQDLGLARLIRSMSPELTIHASTQMTLTSGECIAKAIELGIERVVLPRELSIREIAKIRSQSAIELEVFAHGALCVAYSGQCLTSESLGGRSANRGQCAQACRLPYELICDGEDVDLGDIKYLLSPQDLAAYELVPDLIAAGVDCLKIEGRLKTPEYVANVTQHYRRAIDQACQSGSVRFTDREVTDLELSFSRGFSPGWMEGCDHKRLVPGDSSAKRGVLLGHVESVRRGKVAIRAMQHVSRGDGIVFAGDRTMDGEQGGRVYDVQNDGDRVWLAFGHGGIDFDRLFIGQQIWKTDDPKLTTRLRKSYAGDHIRRRVPIDLKVSAAVGQPLTVMATAENGASCSVQSDHVLAQARQHALTREVLEQQLGRLGGSVYELRRLDAKIEGKPMAPLSVLGALRKQLLAALANSLESPGLPFDGSTKPALAHGVGDESAAAPSLHVLCRNLEQARVCSELDIASILLDFQDIREYRHATESIPFDCPVYLATPRIQKPDEVGIFHAMAHWQRDGFLVRNLAGMEFCRREAIPFVCDYSLNAANEYTLDYLHSQGAERVTASYDLNRDQLVELIRAVGNAPIEIVVHQHMPMFHMEHCVFCAMLSPGTNKTNCGRPCDDHVVKLRDRVGMEHRLTADVGCRNTLFNAVAQSAAAVVPELLTLGVSEFRVEFLDENADEIQQTLRLYRELLVGRKAAEEVWRELKAANRVGVTRGTLEERRNPLAIL